MLAKKTQVWAKELRSNRQINFSVGKSSCTQKQLNRFLSLFFESKWCKKIAHKFVQTTGSF